MVSVGDTLKRDGLTDEGILELFKNAQRDLLDIIARSSSAPYSSYRREQLRAIETVITRLNAKVAKWSGKEVPKIVRAGAKETLRKIEAFDEPEFDFKFSGVSEQAVKYLAEQAFMEFGHTMVALRRNASRALLNKRLLQEKIVSSVIQGSSTARTQTELIDIMRRDGIEVLKAKNGFGRRFSLEQYTNLLVRTQSIAAYNAGARLQLLGAGRRFAKIPKIRPDIDGDDICNEWEEKVYIDLKKDPLPPYHPNCRHAEEPVSFAELKANRPDLYRIAVAEFRAAAE